MGPRRPVQLWLIVAAVLLTVTTGAGIGIAVTGLPHVGLTAPPAPSPPPAAAGPRATEAVADGRSGSTVAATPSGSGATPAVLVRLDADATSSSSGSDVLALLDRHFTAINTRDFDLWTTTVTAARASSQSADHWQHVYRSTVDSNVVVTAIQPTVNGLLMTIEFQSDQSTVDAPADLPVTQICWSSRWPLEGDNGSLRIGTPAKGATAKRQC